MSVKNVDSYVEAIRDLNCRLIAFEGIELFDFMEISKQVNLKLDGFRKTSISIVCRKNGVDAFQITVEGN